MQFMMQRKIFLFCLALFMICLVPKSHAQRGKSELNLGYGYWSIYSLANKAPFNASSGVTTLNYRYYVTKDVTLGMSVGYENISTWASFLSVCPEVTVKYLDTRDDRIRVRLYGAFSYGISFLTDNVTGPGHADETGAKPYGFQATPLGVRFGRQFAYYVEIGEGYKGLVHAGASFRFPRILAIHKHCDDCDEDGNANSSDDKNEDSKSDKKDDKE
jgi:hypothetical protein